MEAKTRRQFLRMASVSALGLSAGSSDAGQATGWPPGVPSHLPRRLAICYWGWQWITCALPDEPYGSLERVVLETKQRGFNCIRVEMGLNWMFNQKGERRGKMKFLDWAPGASSNLPTHGYEKGGGVHDVFERVVELFEVARKHDIYVIGTSWEFQDGFTYIASKAIRDELLGIPYSQRLMLLARHYDRFINVLRKKNLHRRLALAEVINEINSPPIVCSAPGARTQTFEEWVDGKAPTPRCGDEQVRQLAYEAVAFLRERHPDILITIDFASASQLPTLCPDNAQVADHHVYSDGITQAFWRECGIRGGAPPDLNNAFLRSVLKPNPMSWEEFNKRSERVKRGWRGPSWLYQNLDNRRFDEWCLAHYSEYKERIQASIDKKFRTAADFAKQRNLPLVVDEGYILWPPLHSRIVTTPEGRWGEEVGVDAAIATNHWGILSGGYALPHYLPVWADDSQVEWLRRVNRRILAS